MKRITIAIDGYSSCGKSTLAKQLAHHLHYTYIDSGAMYRAVALYAMENGLITDDALDTPNLLRVLPNIHIAFKHDDATQRSATMLDGRNDGGGGGGDYGGGSDFGQSSPMQGGGGGGRGPSGGGGGDLDDDDD